MTTPTALKTAVKAGTVAGFGAASAVHLAWARGSTWPRDTPDQLADLVVGHRPFPSPAACSAVALALGGAAIAVATAERHPISRRTAALASRALLSRGVGGFAASSTGIGGATNEFRAHDLRFYSPLCLALGVGARVVSRPPAP